MTSSRLRAECDKSEEHSFLARKQGVLDASPLGSFMRKWDFLIIGALLWTAVVTPAEVAFSGEFEQRVVRVEQNH